MDHYIEITILQDPEFQENMLMGALFNKLHRGLVELQSNRIAVSFPAYECKGRTRTLGNSLRIHGEKHNLETLMTTHWLKGMNDHIEKTEISPVPAEHKPIEVSRVQCKSNVERLRARRMKRHGETRKQAVAAIPDNVEQTLKLPFVVIKSASTGQQFRLFIRQTEVASHNNDATFNCYGLSRTGTVPGF